MQDCAVFVTVCGAFTGRRGRKRLCGEWSQWKKKKREDVLPMNSIPSSSAAPFKDGMREKRGRGEKEGEKREEVQQLESDVPPS